MGSATRRAQSARRIGRLICALIVLGGLGILGYLGWEYYGSNVLAKRHHAEIIAKWDSGQGDAIGVLRIPRFGADFRVPILPGFSNDSLARGVAWYDKGAEPGEIGNLVLAGHRVTHGEPFKDFTRLRAGDAIIVETRAKRFTYRLTTDGDAITVDFHQKWPTFAVPTPDPAVSRQPTKAMITLLTCAELFHTDNRLVAIGELVDTQPRTGAP